MKIARSTFSSFNVSKGGSILNLARPTLYGRARPERMELSNPHFYTLFYDELLLGIDHDGHHDGRHHKNPVLVRKIISQPNTIFLITTMVTMSSRKQQSTSKVFLLLRRN